MWKIFLVAFAVLVVLFIWLTISLHNAPIMHKGANGMHRGYRKTCPACNYQDYVNGKELDPRE